MSRKKEIIFTVVIPFVVLVYRAHGMEIGVYGKNTKWYNKHKQSDSKHSIYIGIGIL